MIPFDVKFIAQKNSRHPIAFRHGVRAIARFALFTLFAFCFLLFTPALAQDKIKVTSAAQMFSPAMTLENPLNPGYLGLVAGGGTIQNKTRIANEPDANAGVYLGLGKPEQWIGGGITVNIYGLTNSIGEQNNVGQGSANFHVNRFFCNKKLLLDVGVDNAFMWGGNKIYRQYITYQRSFYVTGNYLFYLNRQNAHRSFGYLAVTAGAGNGYFRRDKNYTQTKSGGFDPFLSLATPVAKGTNIIAEWNGYDLGFGLSTMPYCKLPLLLTAAATDFVQGSPRYVFSVTCPFVVRKVANGASPALLMRPVGIRPVRIARTI